MDKKNVLITAGPVYGKLDDNKLVSNRIRGIWATKFGDYLSGCGHHVTLLLPKVNSFEHIPSVRNVVYHDGYYEYKEKCEELAWENNAAVMAGAVVNWIPKDVIVGKMATEGFKEGDVQNIPFILAPRVIDRMKKVNPNLTLIGCKMTSGADQEHTVAAAYKTLIGAKCNVVVANDLSNLKRKLLVYPDGATFVYENEFDAFNLALLRVIEDIHYKTIESKVTYPPHFLLAEAQEIMKKIIEKYRDRFVHRKDGVDRVFGGAAVKIDHNAFLLTPREKESMFTVHDCIVVTGVSERTITTLHGKASLNAPLLIKHLNTHGGKAVLHLHEQLPRIPTMDYAPPGTVRDNDRLIPTWLYNIDGHGFIGTLDDNCDLRME